MPEMRGRLDEHGQPVLDLRLAGGTNVLTALVDTGFDGDMLVHRDHLTGAGIDMLLSHVEFARLADGNEAVLYAVPSTIEWFGTSRAVTIHVLPSDAAADEPILIGCRLLRDSRLEIDFPREIVRVSLE